jgi:indoleamine 2,3-dioxygenase
MLDITSFFSEYDIGANGFLPTSEPIRILPQRYEQWNYIMANLPELNSNGQIRQIIDEMDVLSVDELSDSEIKCAYVYLSLMTNSYVWCIINEDKSKFILPKSVAIPIHQVCNKIGIRPILTHAAVDLYNWKLIDPNGKITVDNIRSIYTMTGTIDEEWFYLIMTHIERIGGSIIKSLLNIITDQNTNSVTINLESISKSIAKITRVMNRITEKCDPDIFYKIIRPYLSGWQNNCLIPNGLIYQGIDSDPKMYSGGSAAQSSLISIIDVALGIEHSDNYFEQIKNYMPEKHKNFINYVKTNTNIKEVALANSTSREAYDLCIVNLMSFRKCHYAIVNTYILKYMNNNTDANKSEPVKGTGGTDLKSFLTKAMSETIKLKSL